MKAIRLRYLACSIALGCAVLWTAGAEAQTVNLDSLKTVLKTQKLTMTEVDTNKFFLLLRIGEQYEWNQPDSAVIYFRDAWQLGKKLNYLNGICKGASYYADVLNRRGEFDSSLVVTLDALDVAEKAGDEEWVAKMNVNNGNTYNYKGYYQIALEYYMKALVTFEKMGEKRHLGQLYDVMQTLYYNINQNEEGVEFGEKAVAMFSETPDALNRGFALLNLATNYTHSTPARISDALKCLEESLRIALLHKNIYLEGVTYMNMADNYLFTNQWDKCEIYNRKGYNIHLQLGDHEGLCISSRGMAYLDMYKGDFAGSRKRAMESLEIAQQYEMMQEQYKCMMLLGHLATAEHDFLSMRKYLQAADSIETLIVDEMLVRSAQEMQIKYETEKKELKISALEKEKQLYVWLGIVGGVLLILLIAFLIVRQRMVKQKMVRIEKEQQLTATQAVLDGETAERTRLARDLHDGLGGMLSVVKLNLNDMKQGASLEYAEVQRFDAALKMLDDSIGELRRVSHNLMPDSLARYGLKAALTDFCNSVVGAEFNYFGSGDRLDSKLEVMIYRTVHELVNNVLKHAGATKITVQVVQEPQRIAVTVQDDGCGFDSVAETSGTGLNNIRNRVGSYNGRMEIYSKLGEGTEVNVEFKLATE